VRLIGAADGRAPTGLVPPAHSPLTLDVTFGGLPAPCDTVSVVRVQVLLPLL
jgi:hypothetical protein